MAQRLFGPTVTLWIVALLAQVAFAQQPVDPELAMASVACGLLEIATGNRLPEPDHVAISAGDEDNPFEDGEAVEVQTTGSFGPQSFVCSATAVPLPTCDLGPCRPGPVGTATVTTEGVSHNGTVVASSGVNMGVQFVINPLAGSTGGGRMVPFRIQAGGSVFVATFSHVGTVAETSINAPQRLAEPFSFVLLNVVGEQVTPENPAFKSLGHVASIVWDTCCEIRDRVPPVECPFPDDEDKQLDDKPCAFDFFVEGVAEEGVKHQFQLTAAIGTFGPSPQSGNADAEAIIDPVLSIDPTAEFEPGMRYADFYTITVSPNVVMVPEPVQALQILAALTTLSALAYSRRRANRPGAS